MIVPSDTKSLLEQSHDVVFQSEPESFYDQVVKCFQELHDSITIRKLLSNLHDRVILLCLSNTRSKM